MTLSQHAAAASLLLAVCGNSSLPATAGELICPLTTEATERATDAFALMAQVFQDRRCANCHGAVNPYGPNGGHAGGDITLDNALNGLQGDPAALTAMLQAGTGQPPTPAETAAAQEAIRTYLSATPRLTDGQTIAEILDLGGLSAAGDGICSECHANKPVGWRLAKSRFTGRSTEDLCEFFQQTMDPSQFLQHVTEDPLGFIPTGFAGTRGLTQFGQSFLTAETGRTYAPEPVSGPGSAEFVAAANEWIEALDGTFHKPPSCGCSPVGYLLKGKVDYSSVLGVGPITSAVTSIAFFEAPFVFAEHGSFSAEAEVKSTAVNKIKAPQMTCTTELNSVDTWRFTGVVEEDNPEIKLHAVFTTQALPAVVKCIAGGMAINTPVPAGEREITTTTDIGEITMQAEIETPADAAFAVPGGTAILTLEIVPSF